jgi:hypothetical protein
MHGTRFRRDDQIHALWEKYFTFTELRRSLSPQPASSGFRGCVTRATDPA